MPEVRTAMAGESGDSVSELRSMDGRSVRCPLCGYPLILVCMTGMSAILVCDSPSPCPYFDCPNILQPFRKDYRGYA